MRFCRLFLRREDVAKMFSESVDWYTNFPRFQSHNMITCESKAQVVFPRELVSFIRLRELVSMAVNM